MSHARNLFLTALLAASTTSAQEKKEEFKETYEAFAVAMGTSNPPVIPTGMATTIQINVTRWTTALTRRRFCEASAAAIAASFGVKFPPCS